MNSKHGERKIALINASWHLDLLDIAKSSCIEELRSQGIDVENDVETFTVPGSLEIPLVAQTLAKTGKYAAVVAFGLIVNGGIYRHDFVGHAVIDGIVRVQLETGIPVLSCVLTPLHFHEHDDHLRFFQQHLTIKGREVANSCVKVVGLLKSIS